MRVYVAGHRIDEARAAANAIKRAGHEIASSWVYLDEWEEGNDAKARAAVTDLEEVASSDVIVHLASERRVSGGKHVEFGAALALGLHAIHVGRVENIFHLHPRVVRVETVEDAISALASMVQR